MNFIKTNTLNDVLENVLVSEANAILSISQHITNKLNEAAKLIHQSQATFIIAGIGKSGHIAQKLASTFCSLGKRSSFLHAAEASHGDLGIIEENSVVMILSNSGETPELSDLISYCKTNHNPIIALTSQLSSSLSCASKISLVYGKLKEACIHGLAPTVSTTVSLAIGDALAVGVSYLSKKVPEDFRRFHPGGKLGAQLKTVKDVMHHKNLPIVHPDMNMTDVILTMTKQGFGVAIVANTDNTYHVITDGDLRRHSTNLWKLSARDVVCKNAPFVIDPNQSLSAAIQLMKSNKITSLLVFKKNKSLLGLLTLHDCLKESFA